MPIRRSVALFDNDLPRNRVAHVSHGFITRDGITPFEFRRNAYNEILRYPLVKQWRTEVVNIHKEENLFKVKTISGKILTARKVIIATGMKEKFPNIKGVHDFYGTSLFNCPYCDGWEIRDQAIVLVSEKSGTFQMAKLIYNWSKDLIVCTNGYASLTVEQRELLAKKGVPTIETPISKFQGENGMLEGVEFIDGTFIGRRYGFVFPTLYTNTDFAKQLDYAVSSNGAIEIDLMGRTSVEGLYAAGDITYVNPSQLIYAAASGSKTAMAVNADLVEEDFNVN